MMTKQVHRKKKEKFNAKENLVKDSSPELSRTQSTALLLQDSELAANHVRISSNIDLVCVVLRYHTHIGCFWRSGAPQDQSRSAFCKLEGSAFIMNSSLVNLQGFRV